MSEENVELVRRIYDEGLIDQDPQLWLLELAAPDIEYVNPQMQSSPVFAVARPRLCKRCDVSPKSGASPGMSCTSCSTAGTPWSPPSPGTPATAEARWNSRRRRRIPGRFARAGLRGSSGEGSAPGPRSRRARGVGDVAGATSSSCAGSMRDGDAGISERARSCTTPTSCSFCAPFPMRGRTTARRRSRNTCGRTSLPTWRARRSQVRSFSRPETVWSSGSIEQAAGAGSGARVEMRYYQVWTFRGASVIRIESIRGREEALAAAGLSE